MTQQVDDLRRGDLLGIKEVVDTHVDEDLFVVGFQILAVVDAGDGLAGAEFLGHHRRDDVVVLLVVDGDEEVAFAHRRPPQHLEQGRIALDGDDIGQRTHVGEQFAVGVDDGDFVAVAAQHAGQMTAHFAGAGDDDFHDSMRFVVRTNAAPAIRRPARTQTIRQMYVFARESPNFY